VSMTAISSETCCIAIDLSKALQNQQGSCDRRHMCDCDGNRSWRMFFSKHRTPLSRLGDERQVNRIVRETLAASWNILTLPATMRWNCDDIFPEPWHNLDANGSPRWTFLQLWPSHCIFDASFRPGENRMRWDQNTRSFLHGITWLQLTSALSGRRLPLDDLRMISVYVCVCALGSSAESRELSQNCKTLQKSATPLFALFISAVFRHWTSKTTFVWWKTLFFCSIRIIVSDNWQFLRHSLSPMSFPLLDSPVKKKSARYWSKIAKCGS
jgi:hypothetical protein